MSRFPHLSETFILREMTELEAQGWSISLFPLIFQEQVVTHAEAREWLPRVRRLPFLSLQVILINIATMIRQPMRYMAVWIRALWENRTSPNFLIRTIALIPKACYAASLMRREGITHIHAHYATHPALVAWSINRLVGIPYSITVHAHDIFVRTQMLATKLRGAEFIVAISEYNREHISRLVGEWVKSKTHIVHCGIRLEDYLPRTRPYANNERFEILSIGSLQPYKGHEFLVRACALLKERGIPFRCRIIGGGQERSRLEQLIASMELASQVELLGARSQEEVAGLLAEAHCYVQPSIIMPSGRMEGIPVALVEALACSLPVVATSLSGIPELVRPDETGWLVPPEDAEALADVITIVYNNPDQALGHGRAGRQLVLQEFELRSNVAQLAALIAKAIATHPASGGKGSDAPQGS